MAEKKTSNLRWLLLDGWHPFFLIAAVIMVTYLQTIFFDFTGGDDTLMTIYISPFIGNIHNITKIFTTDLFMADQGKASLIYRPLLLMSFILDTWVGGVNAYIYHSTNVLLHIAASILLFVFLKKLFVNKIGAFVLALMFAIHPALTQAVAWIPGRNDTMLAIFVMSSFMAFTNFIENLSWKWYFAHLLIFVLAVFTKETGIFLPSICLAYYVLFRKRKIDAVDIFVILLGWAAVYCLWYLLRQMLFLASPASKVGILFSPLKDVFWVLLVYLGKIIFPVKLSGFAYLYDATPWYGVAAIAAFIAITWCFRPEKWREFIFGLFWLLLFLLPLLIFGVGQAVEYEHRLYVPMIGGTIVASSFWGMLRNRLDIKNKILLATVICGFFMVRTNQYCNEYFNDLSFWSHAVKSSPHYAFVYNNLGSVYYNRGQYKKAEEFYFKSSKITPSAAAYWNLAILYAKFNLNDNAEYYYNQVITMEPFRADAHNGLGLVYIKKKKYKQAVIEYKKAILLDKNFASAYYNLKRVLEITDKTSLPRQSIKHNKRE